MSMLQLILLIMKGTVKSEFYKVLFGLRYPIRLFKIIMKNYSSGMTILEKSKKNQLNNKTLGKYDQQLYTFVSHR